MRHYTMHSGPKPAGYLGGDVPMWRKQQLRDKYIAPLPGIDLGLQNQCRCGLTIYAKWRGRFYCKNCARWIRAPATGENGEKR